MWKTSSKSGEVYNIINQKIQIYLSNSSKWISGPLVESRPSDGKASGHRRTWRHDETTWQPEPPLTTSVQLCLQAPERPEWCRIDQTTRRCRRHEQSTNQHGGQAQQTTAAHGRTRSHPTLACALFILLLSCLTGIKSLHMSLLHLHVHTPACLATPYVSCKMPLKPCTCPSCLYMYICQLLLANHNISCKLKL